MRRGLGSCALILLLYAGAAAADQQGWSYLIDKLVEDGVARQRVLTAFGDPRIPPFDELSFSPARPQESKHRYRRFLSPSGTTGARHCRNQYAAAFERAERLHGVSADVLAAILFVETGCGRNTGSSLVFYRLARLAMANEPDNLQRNIERHSGPGQSADPATEAQLRARARYLEETFYPEVLGLFEVATRMGLSPIDLRGSSSGAFGFPQFLPTSYLKYAADGDGDGHISLYDHDDAAVSCARYFHGHGWRPGLSNAQRRAVVWAYNHSNAYVDTVLTLAARIGAPAVQVAKAKRKPSRSPASRRAASAKQRKTRSAS